MKITTWQIAANNILRQQGLRPRAARDQSFTILIASLMLAAGLLCLPAARAADELPPAGDVWATNWFGVSKGEPIYSGWMIVKGRYIDAPYIVEQRGYGIFVNDLLVEYAVQPKTVFAPKQEPIPPANIDPGYPTDLTKTNTGSQAMVHGISSMKKRYLRQKFTNDEEYVEHLKQYYESLPCVASAIIEGSGSTAEILITDYYGKKSYLGTTCSFEAPRPYTRENMQKSCGFHKSNLEDYLKQGFMVTSYGPGIFHQEGAPGADERWRAIFAALESSLSPEEKFNRLKALGYFSGSDTAGWAIALFRDFLINFQGSAQMHQRLNGEDTWKDEARKKLSSATGGATKASAPLALSVAPPPAAPQTSEDQNASNQPPPPGSPPPSHTAHWPRIAIGAALILAALGASASWVRRR